MNLSSWIFFKEFDYSAIVSLFIFICTLRVSEAFRSSLMTAERASGLMPCSQSRTQMDSDSMSKPVFSNLEISSRTVEDRMILFSDEKPKFT